MYVRTRSANANTSHATYTVIIYKITPRYGFKSLEKVENLKHIPS